MDAARAERDRPAAIQATFSSFTCSYSIPAAGGAHGGPQRERGQEIQRKREWGGGEALE